MSERVVACQWSSIVKATCGDCGELPTTKARNGCYYCSFHYSIIKDYPAFEDAAAWDQKPEGPAMTSSNDCSTETIQS